MPFNKLKYHINDINTDTDNIVVIWYHNYSGGKTLLNCLALNDGALFPDKNMAEAQLDGKFTTDDKMNYVRTELSKLKKGDFWNDLNLSCDNFFGIKKAEYEQQFRGVYYNTVVKRAVDSNLKFFRATHYKNQLFPILNIWKNAKLILLDNVEQFVERRCKADHRIINYYDMLKGFRENINELSSLPNVVAKFDTRAWDRTETTVEEVERMYNVLNLPNFNKNYIAEYHKKWLIKVDELSRPN